MALNAFVLIKINLALLAIFLASGFALDHDIASPWVKLGISSRPLGSISYRDFRVNVYQQLDKRMVNRISQMNSYQTRYFYAPIALLDQSSATSEHNQVTKQFEMNFNIEMWNDELSDKIIDYLIETVNEDIKPHQVQVIPFDKVILGSSISSTVYSLPSKWLSYRQEKSLSFSLSCFEQKECLQLVRTMRNSPKQFNHLKLLFSVSSQRWQSTIAVIRLEDIVSSQMAHKLQQRNNGYKKTLLTKVDESRLLLETTNNIILKSLNELDVVSDLQSTLIYSTLKNLTVSSTIKVTKRTRGLWRFTYWDDETYRPDESAQKLNHIYSKLDMENQRKMSNAYQPRDVGEDFLIDFRLSERVNLESTNSSYSKEYLDKLYQESKDYVEWDGQEFTPKSTQLVRTTLGKLFLKQSFQDRAVSVRFTAAALSSPVKIADKPEHMDTTINELKKEITGKILC